MGSAIELNTLENWKMYFYFLIFFLFIGVKEIGSLQCYAGPTTAISGCVTPSNKAGYTPLDTIEKECTKQTCLSSYKFCMKVKQNGWKKVERGCGQGKATCAVLAVMGYNQCDYCNSDLCNSAPYLFPACLQWIAALSSIAVASVMRFY